MTHFVGALDQGTTSTRFAIFDPAGQLVAIDQREHRQILPEAGWVEHDPLEILDRARAVIAGAIGQADLDPADLVAIGIANQRETTVVWDRHTGRPVHNAIVWQDTRTDQLVAELGRHAGQDRFRAATGLPLATYFSGPKLRWILDHVPAAQSRADAGDLLFGTIDTWLIWNLTGGPGRGIHVTDATNASRTQLMNLAGLDWDEQILAALAIPRAMLPRICSSSEVYGQIADGQIP
ncbi:MAG TPA: FGGY family carbohydrate kinase, partial [Candidatus Limnocylindrales bacterium]